MIIETNIFIGAGDIRYQLSYKRVQSYRLVSVKYGSRDKSGLTRNKVWCHFDFGNKQ